MAKCRLLIVDDNRDYLDQLEKTIEEEHIPYAKEKSIELIIEKAYSPEELEERSKNTYDIILSDLCLTDKDEDDPGNSTAIQWLEKIKDTEPIIILLSAYIDDDDIVQSIIEKLTGIRIVTKDPISLWKLQLFSALDQFQSYSMPMRYDKNSQKFRSQVHGVTEPERYSLDLSSLDSHRFFQLLNALLRRFSFDSVHTLPMDNIFSFIALNSTADSLGETCLEVILICLDKGSRRRLKDNLDSARSPREARAMIFQEVGRHAAIPSNASLILLLPFREGGSEGAGELRETFSQGFPGRVSVWDREDIKEQLYRKGASLIPRFFAPAGQLLEQALKEKAQEAEEKQARINELKRANQRLHWEERNRAKAERDAVWKSLSQRIAHKLGNPIDTIGLIEGNMRHPLTEEEKTGFLDKIRDTLRKCNRLLREMKDYAATGVKLARTRSWELLPLLALPFEKKGYKVEKAVPPCALHADTDKLGQVLDELIANGECHAEAQRKTPVMTLSFSRAEGSACPLLDEKRKYLLLAVADNGPGVPEDRKSEIFNLYFTTRREGSGQGLAIAEKIIRDHDGAIVEEGREGALFKIYLPIIGDEEDFDENTADRR